MSEIKYNCIYFSNTKKDLSYKEREHVIPASLGGKATLPRGMVSDQANELFSKYELKAIRSTFLSINRNNNGPGKRGSLSVKKIEAPLIRLFSVVENGLENNLDTKYAPIRLGFLFCGRVYMITQILFLINEDGSIKVPRIIMDTICETSLPAIKKFCLKLNSFILKNNKKYIVVNSEDKCQHNYINIGTHNDKWFISSSFCKDYIKKFLRVLEIKSLPENIPVILSSEAMYHFSDLLPDLLDDSFQFLYAKTAFNALAFFTSCDFVLQSQFDSIRKSILSLNNINDFFIERKMPKWLIEWVNDNVKPKEHFLVINAEKNCVEAYVSFYREPLSHVICLSANYVGVDFRKFFVCNWKDRIENYY
jgi:hypothetical protein